MVHRRLRDIAARAGSRIALHTPAGDLTFDELIAGANAVAARLVDRAPGRIGIVASDHRVIVPAMVGVLEAGHAFAPLDPSQERFVDALRLDTVIRTVERSSIEVSRPVQPDAMCSIYLTSGSTGAPRAIAGRRCGIDHHIAWEIEALGLDERTRGAIIHSPTYDAYLPDVLVPLCAGGVACAPPTLEPAELCRWLRDQRITLLHCTPTLFRALLGEPGIDGLVELRHVLLAGEVVRHDDVRGALAAWGDRVRLLNLYGPTEATLVKLHHEITRADLALPSIPIGRPMPGVAVELLDEHERPVGGGEVGQIAIRSRYGSLGYLDDPELTRAKFRDAPDGEQVYLTGDFGSRLPDGRLLFCGRRDRQIKLCGARVDLDEVEAILAACGDIGEVAVIAAGDSVLHGFVVLRAGGTMQTVREHAGRSLTPAMRLAWLTELAELPRTTSGKIDRKQLLERA